MAVLEVTNLKFKYQDKELYNNANFKLNQGEHMVLVGPNGCGKSTFMNLICKNLIPDAGKITWLPNITYGYLDQQLKVKQDISIHDYLYEVFEPLYAKEREMNKLFESLGYANEREFDRILEKANNIQDELEKKKFFQLNSTVGNMTNGLGITGYGMDTHLNKLSGGQRAKVYLAKLLLDTPDVILMDEPTNFLDSEHIDWLARYLNAFSGTFIVISHDEAFLRQIGKVVYCLSNKQFERYKGDYDFYLREHELRTEQYEAAYNAQQRQIKKTEAFIQKNIVRATSAKAAKSKRKMLEHMDVLERPVKETEIHINFPYSRNLGTETLVMKDLVVGYNSKAILPPINIMIKHNDKVAILGHNGVGKSTILKTILGVIPAVSGSYHFNPSADINYFSQEEKFNMDETPIDYLRYHYHLKTDGDLRSVLAKVGLRSDLVTKPMRELSGGEQTKVRLALMTMKKSNLLILDEPTNHLDVKAKEVLYEAIENFDGAVILVSHEHDFYDELVDYIIEFK